MNVNEMLESKYLRKADVGDGLVVTVQALEKKNVALDDQPRDEKWLLKFVEVAKPLVLNKTNIRLLAKVLGPKTDDWMGRQIELYVDETVPFSGQLVGGIRVRANRPAPRKRVVRDINADLNEMTDDIPM